jgi:hypothetical protein
MTLQLPIELANQIIGYLGTRPYQEVYALIQAMQEAAKPPQGRSKWRKSGFRRQSVSPAP